MNDCPNGELRDLLPDLLHDRLSGPDRARVEAHVAACADCADELALLRSLRGTMGRVPAIDTAAIAAAIPAYRAPARRSNWTAWRAAAAIATIAIGGTSIAVANRTSVETRPDDVPAFVAPDVTVPATAPGRVATTARPADSSLASTSTATSGSAVRAPDAVTSASREAAPAGGTARELAMGGGAVTELSDRELSALLNEIESLDALPSADAEGALPLTPLDPAGAGR